MSRAFMRVLMIGKSILRMWSPYVTALLSILSSVYGVSSEILSTVLICLRYGIPFPPQWDDLEWGGNACSLLNHFPEHLTLLEPSSRAFSNFCFHPSVLLKDHLLWPKVSAWYSSTFAYVVRLVFPLNSKELAFNFSCLLFLCFCLLCILVGCIYTAFVFCYYYCHFGILAADIFVKLMSQHRNLWQPGIWL